MPRWRKDRSKAPRAGVLAPAPSAISAVQCGQRAGGGGWFSSAAAVWPRGGEAAGGLAGRPFLLSAGMAGSTKKRGCVLRGARLILMFCARTLRRPSAGSSCGLGGGSCGLGDGAVFVKGFDVLTTNREKVLVFRAFARAGWTRSLELSRGRVPHNPRWVFWFGLGFVGWVVKTQAGLRRKIPQRARLFFSRPTPSLAARVLRSCRGSYS